MEQSTELRIALLTTGKGRLAHSCFDGLLATDNLKAVVFSQKNKVKKPLVQKIKEYGIWYGFQHLFSKISCPPRKKEIKTSQLSKNSIKYTLWKDKSGENKILEFLQENDIDLIFVCGFHYILSETILNTYKTCINIHPSILPNYRGPEPIIWGLLDQSDYFGITLHYIDKGIDTGNILNQHAIEKPIIPLLSIIELRLSKALPNLIQDTVTNITNNNVISYKQKDGGFYLSSPTIKNRVNRHKN